MNSRVCVLTKLCFPELSDSNFKVTFETTWKKKLIWLNDFPSHPYNILSSYMSYTPLYRFWKTIFRLSEDGHLPEFQTLQIKTQNKASSCIFKFYHASCKINCGSFSRLSFPALYWQARPSNHYYFASISVSFSMWYYMLLRLMFEAHILKNICL